MPRRSASPCGTRPVGAAGLPAMGSDIGAPQDACLRVGLLQVLQPLPQLRGQRLRRADEPLDQLLAQRLTRFGAQRAARLVERLDEELSEGGERMAASGAVGGARVLVRLGPGRLAL